MKGPAGFKSAAPPRDEYLRCSLAIKNARQSGEVCANSKAPPFSLQEKAVKLTDESDQMRFLDLRACWHIKNTHAHTHRE